MNGRKSFEPYTNNPVNINIYYNINSKNITNNHEVQSYPATARITKNVLQDDSRNQSKIDIKSKISTRTRKKKYSMDLGIPTQRKTQKVNRKSNNVSICSGFPSQANCKKDINKSILDKKAHNTKSIEKTEKKISQLLSHFNEGKIDKTKLTKQIVSILQQKGTEQTKQKKIPKKKKSLSTIIGTCTPKNTQMPRLSSATTNNIRTVHHIHNVRRKQSKSQKGNYSNANANKIIRQQIMEQIIQSKAINSSLCLQLDDDQRFTPMIVNRENDVQTSHSIVILNEKVKKQINKFCKSNLQQVQNQKILMAIKIQRAWRKYKTKRLIKQIIKPKMEMIVTDQHSFLQKIQCFSGKNSVSVENFLSQELTRKNVVKESQVAKVEELRDHQLQKWNDIMNYVKSNINNKSLSSGECLVKIIEYFENAKMAVQKQLQLQGPNNNKKLESKQSRQITQFTNKAFSKELQKGQNNQSVKIVLDQDQCSPDKGQFFQHQQQQQVQQEKQYQCYQDESGDQQQCNLQIQQDEDKDTYKNSNGKQPQGMNFIIQDQFEKLLNKKSDNLSFQVVQTALIKYSKKITYQYEQNLKKLDIHSTNYLQSKRNIQQKFKQSKKELKRIINNLNQGYLKAKRILQKQCLLDSEQSSKNSQFQYKQTLHKCKSDNYLLKTAINYKKYIEKKQRKDEITLKSNDSSQNMKVLIKVKNKDNLQSRSVESSQVSDISIAEKLKYADVLQQSEQKQEIIQNKSDPFDINQFQGGQGCISNAKQKKFNRLQQKVISQQFLQYEQLHKNINDDDQKQQASINSYDNNKSAQQISLFENTKINENNRKLKFITSEDKDDIFQFLFIDLTLQLITQYEQDSKIYKAIKKYVEKRKRLQSVPKGIKTNLQACKQYLNLLSKTITVDFGDMFFRHICVPMGPTARQMLKYMHDEDNNEDCQQNQDLNVPLILPVNVFEKVQSKSVTEYPRYYQDENKEISRVKFLKSISHIHHKAIFDSLNECLDAERPYGIWGVPFPWKTTHKNNRNFQIASNQKIIKLQQGIQKVVQCSSYMCGILSDKQDSIFGNHKVSQHYIQQIRQDRMSKMLANELLQNQERWSFYDDQQTQVLIQLSRVVCIQLVQQVSAQCHQFFRSSRSTTNIEFN